MGRCWGRDYRTATEDDAAFNVDLLAGATDPDAAMS